MQPPLTNSTIRSCKAMSSHTNDLSDISSPKLHSKRSRKSMCAVSLSRYAEKTFQHSQSIHINNHKTQIEAEGSLTTPDLYRASLSETHILNPTTNTTQQWPPQSHIPATPLDLILAKLNELDAIKTHLSVIDCRLDQIQPPLNNTG